MQNQQVSRWPFGQEQFTCQICKFSCDTFSRLQAHFQEKNHNPGTNAQAVWSERPLNKPGWWNNKPQKSMHSLRDYINRPDREPLIGLEYVTEYKQKKTDKIETKYKCEICDVDSELAPMIEHLTGSRHRKLYLAREYPFVLKAPFNKDLASFMKRMALEIEQEEGIKMYKIDPATKLESLLTLKVPQLKKSQRKSRWDIEGNSESRKKKALEYLENFNIESESEATKVTNLTDKLTEGLKVYTAKANEESLFPARVAKAKDVAVAIIQNSLMERNTVKSSQKKMPGNNPPFNPNTAENMIMKQSLGAQGHLPNPIIHGTGTNQLMNLGTPLHENNSSISFIQRPNQLEGFLPNPRDNIQNCPQPELVPENELSSEDIVFFKKLRTLLNALPTDNQNTGNMQLDKKLMLLKTLLQDNNPNMDTAQVNQDLMTQLASLVRDNTAPGGLGMGNPNLNSLMQVASLLQNTFNTPMGDRSALLTGQNFQNYPDTSKQGFGDLEYRNTMGDTRNTGFHGSEDAPYASAYDNTVLERDPYPDPHASDTDPYDNQNDPSYSDPYVTTRVNDYQYDDYREQPLPYTRVSLPPRTSATSHSSENYRDAEEDFNREGIPRHDVFHKDMMSSYQPNQRFSPGRLNRAHSSHLIERRRDLTPPPQMKPHDLDYHSRPIHLSERFLGESSLRERDLVPQIFDYQAKRARLDRDRISPPSERGLYDSRQPSLDVNTAGLSAEILKKIRGKDLFTVSAILAEYAETQKLK
ncbi:uncharacterized protein LOC128497661 [Spea bombifrons]|uniref:uncharacterized protein LOC128497661 n=1 Tax=Spea bombifrons TaxID=233779 RepID=UPI0023499975|nr:uncharacterized protein LOC128497661 [Spea bombifrons]